MMEKVINKIAQSGLITLNLEKFFPKDFEIIAFDLKPYLFQELILKEKDFRKSLSELNWAQFSNKNVAVFCSVDAIIPAWAYMLIAVNLAPFTKNIFYGKPEEWKEQLLLDAIQKADISKYENEKIILKGCGATPVPESAYITLSLRLQPIVSSLMFGEACSTVPIFKKKK